jgi:LCP family protein required for cell wall assembly
MARWMWKRFALAGLLVILMSAGAVAAAGILTFNHVADLLHVPKGQEIHDAQLASYHGGPETFLIFGSDHRSFQGNTPGNSDTQMLIRFDPGKGEMTMLSIPRDLKVENIPGHGGPYKINAAYSFGGAKLGLRVIEQVLGPSVQINHVIDTDFRGFRQAVDAIGGVYAQVDHRYFNDVTGPGGYAAINIQPGYQKLDGSNALDYVRFRHTDTDLVREARQQDFVTQVRTQLGATKLINNEDRLLSIFAHATSSDIVNRDGAFYANLFLLIAGSIGHPIRQVPFQVTLGPSYVTATQAQIDATVNQFLNGTAVRTSSSTSVVPAGRAAQAQHSSGLRNAAHEGQDQAIVATSAGLPIYYPRLLTSDGFYDGQTRTYSIPDFSNHPHHAYVMVVEAGYIGLGQYYDIQGTTWTSPPILAGPHDTQQIGGRTYQIYYEGQHIRTVALNAGYAVYWVENTLLRKLSNSDMMGIATSLTRCC